MTGHDIATPRGPRVYSYITVEYWMQKSALASTGRARSAIINRRDCCVPGRSAGAARRLINRFTWRISRNARQLVWAVKDVPINPVSLLLPAHPRARRRREFDSV